jgi:serpin B
MKRGLMTDATLVAFALVAAACGDDSDAVTTTLPATPAPTTTPAPAPSTTLAPPAGTTAPPPTTAPGVVVTGELARADVPRATSTEITEDQLGGLVAGNTEFAFDLLRLIGDDENTIISPFSIAAALTMTYAGARGLTADQMADVLHLVLSGSTVHEGRNELALRIADTPAPSAGDDREPLQVNIANSLWGQRGFGFEAEFLETLAAAYDAGVRLVDFVADSEAARVAINDWVAEETMDRIVDLLPAGSLNVDTRLVLTNAIWFKASWVRQFDPDATEPGTFVLLDGTEVTVPMMRSGGRTLYTEGDGYQAARLGYAGDASMTVIAPDPGLFDEIVTALDGAFLASIDDALSTHALRLTMPKFEFESETSLRGLLAGLGMADAFDPMRADFSGISTQRDDLHIQDVVHKAFISVDEQGTEAAAATAVIVGVTSAPPPATLDLDRPFIFLIRHDSTGEILFAGTVTDPS